MDHNGIDVLQSVLITCGFMCRLNIMFYMCLYVFSFCLAHHLFGKSPMLTRSEDSFTMGVQSLNLVCVILEAFSSK